MPEPVLCCKLAMLQCDSKVRRLSKSEVQQRANLCRVMAKSHKPSRDVTAEKKAGTLKSGVAADKKKKKVKRKESYSLYIHKVLKQGHQDTGITTKAMGITNSFVSDIFERIAMEAYRLTKYGKKSTMSSREIQTAVRLLLPGEVAKHAVSEGTKAVTKYTSSK